MTGDDAIVTEDETPWKEYIATIDFETNADEQGAELIWRENRQGVTEEAASKGLPRENDDIFSLKRINKSVTLKSRF